ncbi:LuxR C-terminal-related transcriptional regulator (plasmid) [Arsenophonus nasoniae]|uniref:Bacterial regulatory protein, luxR family n=1 Tax=Arsenophonus nasoniae TaxID=638 RepID=A0A4P7KZ02_9GAMM|nr:PAS and helix-turn-helix domain-containing protein [Arsenophonus nasoniae]QBY45617.1 Bacterial regulatory protein, luxR family [Arsenophonus nasoniae]WGM07883.1 LuxR C-terminal-related transcriptional regulator [Arsenophonus nasoniae]WGM12970.1 LuxR C-terminal-related transcriptional regulator [Arsenophonus nasoniae]WGM17436.1 LuxR C-terminal-related transcriptional regulator [Arsenophonus nasoniae]
MKKNISDNELGSLISFLRHESDPWGVKDLDSKFVYANNLSHLGIKLDFNIEGMFDSELPHPVAELSSNLLIHDHKVISDRKKEIAIQTTLNFKENRLKPYFFEKRPFYNQSGEIVGTIYHGREIVNFQTYDMSPYVYFFTPPNDLFTKRELEVIFWAQQRLTAKEIAKRLDVCPSTIDSHIKSIYRKADVNSNAQLIEYCQAIGLDKYIPPDFLRSGIKFVK